MYVELYGEHFEQSMDQSGMVANPPEVDAQKV